jgi:hypothetical protein
MASAAFDIFVFLPQYLLLKLLWRGIFKAGDDIPF